MKTLYIECQMGAAGDMLMAALYDLLDEAQKQEFLHRMNSLGLPGVTVAPETASTCGISGVHMKVAVNGEEEGAGHAHEHTHEHAHEHTHGHTHGHVHAAPGEIAGRIDALQLPFEVKEHAHQVYDAIARAEAKAHGCPVGDVHFHEVGALDAVADVAGVCYAMHLLKPDRVLASPVHVGSGTVRCAHGVMPVPAPAAANLLEGVPFYGGSIRGELCTPTGAALLVHFAEAFGEMPVMRLKATGIGVGRKQFERPNCVRIFLGETEEDRRETAGQEDACGQSGAGGSIAELVCNIDDMTPEALAFAKEQLLRLGALDVYTVSGTMKKGRPGWELTVLCRPEETEKTARDILRETTTNGVRVRLCEKYFLTPGTRSVRTPSGEVRIKTAEGFGIRHEKPEYEDVASLARERQTPFRQIYEEALLQERQEKEADR